MRSLAACRKLMAALAHALRGWWIIALRFPRMTQAERGQEVSRWAQRMLAILGVELVVQGRPPTQGPLLLVLNHLSWLDILVVHAAQHVRFVAKANIRRWPLVGALATGGGTLYIERERRRDAMRLVHHIAEALQAGDLIAVFPEGTTGEGRELLPFHANLLQGAISAGAPVMPAALRFADRATDATSMAAAYIGDDTLVGSLWRMLTAPPLRAYVCFGEPQAAQGRERRAWAKGLRAEVDALRARTVATASN